MVSYMSGETTSIPLLRTKLKRPPTTGDHIHRLHLLERLDHRRQRPLTLVAAPAGYGKSTLLSCWLESCNLPAAWLSLDEADNDLHLFIAYLLAAVQTVFPAAGKEIQSLLNAPELPPHSILSNVLINELDQIEQPFILCLDDYHVIQNGAIHDLLDEILKHPPKAMHLILATRMDPPLPLASLRGRGKMTEIRVQDLRFSFEETAEFLQNMMGRKLEDGIVALMGKKTEGWVTGLRLAALSLRHRDDLNRALKDLPNDHRYVFDYMAAEVLSQQEPAIQECLLKTSILNRISAPLCRTVCAVSTVSGADEVAGNRFLDWLIQANLFLIPLDDERRWFRYHHLFQELLTRYLKRRFSPDEIDTLHREAGRWFAERGLIEEALHHFLAGGDTQAAVLLIARHRYDLMNQEQWPRLERWLGMIAVDRLEKYPELLMTKAWICEIKVRLSEMEALINRAEVLIADRPPKPLAEYDALTAEFRVIKSFILYLQSDGPGTVAITKLAMEKIDPQALSVQGICQVMMAAGYQMSGRLKKAYETVQNALKKDVPHGTAYHSWLFSGLCFLHWMAADLTGVQHGVHQLLKLGQKTGLPRSIAFGHYFSGILHYLRNELADAETQLGLAVQDIYKADTVNYSHSTFALALCLQAQFRQKEAFEIVERLIGHALESHNSELLTISQAFQAELTLRQGNIPKARQWARNCDPHPFHPGYRFYLPPLTLAKVHLAVNTKKSLQQARDLLLQLHEYYSDIHNVRHVIDILALLALAHDARSEEAEAFEKLTEALRLAEPDQIMRPFLDLGSRMADLLSRLAEQDVSLKYIGTLLKAFRNEITIAAQSNSGMPAPALGAFHIGGQLDSLSKREFEVMSLLAKRLSNKEIADILFVSLDAVKKHLYNIYQKLNVKNRRQAVEKARTLGILGG